MNISTTTTATLYSLAEGLRAESKAVAALNRAEAMRLLTLSQQVSEELRQRKIKSERAYLYN